MKKSTFLVLSMLCAAPATWAQGLATAKQNNVPRVTLRLLDKASAASKITSEYGEVVPVMEEDFSLMSEGSYGAPAMNAKITNDDAEYVWNNMLSDLTHLPGWGHINAFQAGGTVCLLADASTGGARINTPQLDMSGNDGICFIRFRARTDMYTQTMSMGVQAAETNNWGPDWDILGGGYVPTVTDQWQTYEAMFQGGGSTTLFLVFVEGADPQPVYIDDVEVYQVKQYVSTPSVLPHSNYKGEGEMASFTANWTAVDGAEGYLLNVYTLNDDRQPVYLLKDQATTTNSFDVKNAVSGETYYYKVRATKGTHVSIESQECMVFDLAAPVMHDVSDMEEGRYFAEWDEVPSAEVYNYLAYYDRKAAADGEFVIFDDDFSGVVNAEGEKTGWTLENPSGMSYPELYVENLCQAGWRGTSYAPYDGYICLDGWQYVWNKQDAGFISPELDLSKNNGRIDIRLDLYGVYDNDFESQTTCAVALFNWDDAKGDYSQAELVYVDGVNESWQTFNVQLTKGSTRSVIGFYAVRGADNLYIDNLRITQVYRAGESLMDPFYCKRAYFGNELEVLLPAKTNGQEIYHKVNAMKTLMNGQYVAESEYSDLRHVGTAQVSGISSVDKGQQLVSNEVYDLQGRRTSSTLSKGIYITGGSKKVVR